MPTNLQLLMDAGLIYSTNQPSATDIATINGLSQSDVQALIRIYNAVSSTSFLTNNCNPGGTVVPSPTPGQRTIGIVF
ncbi:MAG TPA: hypothetical protein VMD98_03530 [Bryocella sp.]|nr:hypothetical protein [Bryocella sp.]